MSRMEMARGALPWLPIVARLALCAGAAALTVPALGDESGAGFWQVGTYDSFSAVPTKDGWSVSLYGLHSPGRGGAAVSAARLSRIGALDQTLLGDVSSTSGSVTNQLGVTPTYTFSLPALNATAAVSLTAVVGHVTGTETDTLLDVNGLPDPSPPQNFGDSATGFGDLAPQATLYWKRDFHHFMVYAAGNAPVGAYDKRRLANIGIGHGAFDGGAGYTYDDSDRHLEFSAVGGFTYNLINPATNYRSGVDFHLDAAASRSFGQLFVGPVGYFYKQITCDGGEGDEVGCFKSQVAGLGAQLGINFVVGAAQGTLNLKGYREFAAQNREAGWTARATLTISAK
jgi:hypothetical protein